jgi:ABC-2 type transport system permease protein
VRVLTIAHLTWLEARRRRIVLVAVAGGLLFLAVYAVAIFFIFRNINGQGPVNLVQRSVVLEFLLLAGLYVVNFLTIAVAILLPVDTISGEISSGVMQTVASKPIRRAEIVLGKCLTYWLMTAGYLVLMGGGVVASVRFLTGFSQPHVLEALPLLLLGATVMLMISTAGGIRLTTITNGMVAFAFYGIAFVGGWVEQIGTVARSDAARYIGTAVSLVSPADAMWRRAAYELQPGAMRGLQVTPFVTGSVPSGAMIVWTIGFVIATLGLALYLFRRRAL